MKKRPLTLFLVLVMIVSLTSCGGGISGVYNMTKIDAAGLSSDTENLPSILGGDVNAVLSLKNDDTFSLDIDFLNSNYNKAGTWTINGNTLTLLSDDTTVLTGTVDGSVITLVDNNDTMTFEKQ